MPIPILQEHARQCQYKKDQKFKRFYQFESSRRQKSKIYTDHHFYPYQKLEILHLNFEYFSPTCSFYQSTWNNNQIVCLLCNISSTFHTRLKAFLYHQYQEHIQIHDHKEFHHFTVLLSLQGNSMLDEVFKETSLPQVSHRQLRLYPNIFHRQVNLSKELFCWSTCLQYRLEICSNFGWRR